jgi:uncharacterized repeat protein (TIGR02543 family)
VNWTGDYSGTSNPLTVSNVTANKTITANFAINQYTLTYIAGTGGTLTGSTPQTVNHGANGTAVTAVANTGYHFTGWSDGVATATRTETNITANKSVTANFAINTYTVTFDLAGKGTRSGGGVLSQTINHGSGATAPTVTPSAGWTFTGWDKTFSNISSDTTVTAQYSAATYTVTFVQGVNGTITGTKVQTVSHGTSSTEVTAVPLTGYHFVNWTGGITSTVNPLIVSNVTSAMTITANFAINTYTVTFDLAGKGTRSGGGVLSQTINHGSGATAPTVTPSAGWSFTGWDKTFNNITGNTTVTAQYSGATYTVTFVQGTNGTITGTKVQTVNHGASTISVTAVPNTGYHFVNWTGSVTSTDNPLTVSNVTAAMTITANFAINTYTVTFDLAGKGTRSGGGVLSQTINYGSGATAPTVTPSAGWTFTGWDKTFSNIIGDTTVTAQYSIVTYTVTFIQGANGTITGTKVQTVSHGTSSTEVTAVPSTGYHFVNWTGGITSTANPLTVLNVTSAMTITVNFAINTYALAYSPGSNGTLSGITSQTVNHGANGTAVTAVPNTGYLFVKWSDNVMTTSRTDTNVTADKTVTASFAPDTIAPSFTLHPSGTSVAAWQTASFTVSAAGTPTPIYQWELSSNGGGSWSNVTTGTGGTTSSYTTPITVSGDSGKKFRCVATNSVNSATSNAATLTVTAATSVRTISGTLVSIAVMPPAGTSAWGVEETISAGLTPSAITGSNGNWNSTTRKITWYATGAATATLGYSVSGSDGSYMVAGTASFDGANSTVGGPTAIVILAYHPADTNKNSIMVMSEAIAYLAGWQQGSNPMNYAIRAAYLWQNGESYTRQNGVAEPLCWVSASASLVAVASRDKLSPLLILDTVSAGALRSISGNSVTISVAPPVNTSAWGYEELVPVGLTPTNITGSNGNWNTNTRKITWYSTGAAPAALGYSVSGNDGNYTVSGNVSFDGADTTATGNSQIVLGDYTVTFDLAGKGERISGGALTQTINYGSGATAPTVSPNAGWSLSGWDKAFDNISSELTVNAQYSAATYTVTYDAEGGTVSPPSKIVTYNAAYGTLDIPTRNGYTFAGWWTGDNGTGTQVSQMTTVSNTANHTIYAKWTANIYTVTYDAQGGTVSPASKTVTFGAAYGALASPARNSYAFAGWWTGVNGTGTKLSSAIIVSNAANHSIYAKWVISAVGVALEIPIPPEFVGLKVTVKGLPAGLRYDASIGKIIGVPSKPGVSIMEISAPGVPTQTITISAGVLPLWAQGTFDGTVSLDLIDDADNWNNYPGTATMTVTSLGKITGKLSAGGKSYTFNATSYSPTDEDGVLSFQAIAKIGTTSVPLSFRVSQPIVIQEVSVTSALLGSKADGTYEGTDIKCEIHMYRNVWKDSDMLSVLPDYAGYYTAVLPGGAEYGSGYLAITVDKAGGVKTTGKLADGTALSLSGSLIFRNEPACVFAVIYTSPTTYKGGCLFGLAKFAKPEGGDKMLLSILDEDSQFLWESRNPQATSVYGDGGFNRELGLVGGWYDKIGNLSAYYQDKDLSASADAGTSAPELIVGVNRYTSACWKFSDIALTPVLKSAVMTGLAVVPKAGLPVNLGNNKWNYDAENTAVLTIGLTRATGIFKGSFKAWFDYNTTHTSRTITYEGVLTPEREVKEDGVEGCGFFLWADKAPNPLGRMYPFNWSYDFLIQSGE